MLSRLAPYVIRPSRAELGPNCTSFTYKRRVVVEEGKGKGEPLRRLIQMTLLSLKKNFFWANRYPFPPCSWWVLRRASTRLSLARGWSEAHVAFSESSNVLVSWYVRNPPGQPNAYIRCFGYELGILEDRERLIHNTGNVFYRLFLLKDPVFLCSLLALYYCSGAFWLGDIPAESHSAWLRTGVKRCTTVMNLWRLCQNSPLALRDVDIKVKLTFVGLLWWWDSPNRCPAKSQ